MTVFVAALVTSLAAVFLLRPLLVRINVMDVPNQRSSHRTAVPRAGGLAALLGVALSAILGGAPSAPSWTVVVWVVAALAGLGLIDDIVGLAPLTRLAVQATVCLPAAVILLQGQDAWPIALAGAVAAAVWLAGFMNMFNFMDGINGISAFNAMLAGGWYAWLGASHELNLLYVVGLALAGAAAGFAPWNAHRARVFLGDVGSYGLGVLIALLALVGLLHGVSPLLSVSPLLIYVADTSWACVKRLKRGVALREAHREHVYQRLVDSGWRHLAGAGWVTAFGAAVCVVAASLPIGWAVVVASLLLVLYLSSPRWAPAMIHRPWGSAVG